MFEIFQNVDVKITDSSFLRSIPQEKIAQYLLSRGWHVTHMDEEIVHYTEPMTKRTIELSREYDSFAESRIRHSLDVLQTVYWDNQLVLVEKILNGE